MTDPAYPLSGLLPVDKLYQSFLGMLLAACAKIADPYFAVPIAGHDEPIVRERAYCYELFHQLRVLLEPNFPFTLHGEIHKRGHPMFADCVENRNPDFVVHRPGTIGAEGNLAVIEVKPAVAQVARLADDLRGLVLFRDCIEYHRGILLVYGGMEEDVRRSARAAAERVDADLARVDLVWHPRAGEGGVRLAEPWD